MNRSTHDCFRRELDKLRGKQINTASDHDNIGSIQAKIYELLTCMDRFQDKAVSNQACRTKLQDRVTPKLLSKDRRKLFLSHLQWFGPPIQKSD